MSETSTQQPESGASLYEAAFLAYTQVVQRAFVVAGRRLALRGEPVDQAVIAGFRFDGARSCHIVVLICRPDGTEVRYGMRVYPPEIDAVTDAEIAEFGARLAEQRYERDIAAYTRVMAGDDDLVYLRDRA